MRPRIEMEENGALHEEIREYAWEQGLHPRIAYRKLLIAGLEAEKERDES